MARRHGAGGTRRIAAAVAAACLLLPAGAGAGKGGEVSLLSRSYVLGFEREDGAGNTTTHVPLYEYLSIDATGIDGSPVSARFYGMGRVDLADDTGSGPTSGDVGAFYVEYRHPKGNGEAKAGRFFLAEGGAFETLDGAFVKGSFPGGLGLSLYGGKPVEQGGIVSAGDALYGARGFFARGGVGEVGLSFLRENGDFPEPDGTVSDRTLASTDLWLRVPGLPAEVSGRADYNVATHGLARTKLALKGRPAASLDLSLAYDGYDTGDLSHGATNAPFLRPIPSYPLGDAVDTLALAASWQATGAFSLDGSVKGVHHSKGVVGDAILAFLGGRFAYNGGKDSTGADLSFCRGDRAEDRVDRYRLFATWSPGKARFTADGLVDLYKEEIAGTKRSYQATGTASWDVTDYIRIGGDATWTDGPRLSNDLAVLARISLGFGVPAGGAK